MPNAYVTHCMPCSCLAASQLCPASADRDRSAVHSQSQRDWVNADKKCTSGLMAVHTLLPRPMQLSCTQSPWLNSNQARLCMHRQHSTLPRPPYNHVQHSLACWAASHKTARCTSTSKQSNTAAEQHAQAHTPASLASCAQNALQQQASIPSFIPPTAQQLRLVAALVWHATQLPPARTTLTTLLQHAGHNNS